MLSLPTCDQFSQALLSRRWWLPNRLVPTRQRCIHLWHSRHVPRPEAARPHREPSCSMPALVRCTRLGELCSPHGDRGSFMDLHVPIVTSGASCNSNGFDRTICPDAATCGKNCALEGVDYAGKFGVTTSGNALSLVFGTSGSRVYLLDNTGIYKNFHVMNQEFSFDVDVSKLPCGFNGALYFSEMPPDGGLSSINKAGAAYGTGYCDSQCPRGLQFINGTVCLCLSLPCPIVTCFVFR